MGLPGVVRVFLPISGVTVVNGLFHPLESNGLVITPEISEVDITDPSTRIGCRRPTLGPSTWTLPRIQWVWMGLGCQNKPPGLTEAV